MHAFLSLIDFFFRGMIVGSFFVFCFFLPLQRSSAEHLFLSHISALPLHRKFLRNVKASELFFMSTWMFSI